MIIKFALLFLSIVAAYGARLPASLSYVTQPRQLKQINGPSDQSSPCISQNWNLLWRDEFDQPGPSIDPSKWSYEIGNGSSFGIPGWGNQEIEVYTNKTSNVFVQDGRLVIQVQLEPEGVVTSGRIRTYGKLAIVPTADFPVLRIEASIKMPSNGIGLWPAFWMLPEQGPVNCSGCGVYGNWPASGEIDIVEWNGRNVSGTVFYGSSDGDVEKKTAIYPSSESMDSQYHLYSLEWGLDRMVWAVDSDQYLSAESASSLGTQGIYGSGWYSKDVSGRAPFDSAFYLLLDMAVGGTFPTDYTNTSAIIEHLGGTGPKQMEIDFVRVCAKPAINAMI